MSSPFLKDPSDRVDYQVDFDWIDPSVGHSWLNGDTISSVAWTVPSGLTQYATSNDTTTATIWLTGGTHGQDYTVVCQATTVGGRIKQQGLTIKVRDNVA